MPTYPSALIALADPTRRGIYEAIVRKPRSVCVLASEFPVSRPAVSQHLRALSDAGLVQMQKEGARNVYTARRNGLSDLRAYLDGLWDDVLTAFADEVERMSKP
ncbi:MAG: metalloregulator ArsR/SmtB family transcription factor [Pseudomonadota bacterium]